MIDGCPGAQKFKQPQPEEIKCTFCGEALEIWTDEFHVLCPKCKKTVSRVGQSCLDWCKAAKECVGEEIYNRYMENKKERDIYDVLRSMRTDGRRYRLHESRRVR